MKKEKDEILKRINKKSLRIKLMKNFENNDDNSKIFGSTFTSNFHTNNKNSNALLNLKLNKIKKPKNLNLTNQSTLIKNSTNNKIDTSTGFDTYRNNRNKKNEIKMSSSFYVTQEEKNNRNKKEIKNMIFNLSLNDGIKKRNVNKKDILGNSFTYRNNINTNKDKNKIILNKKLVLKEPENKINKLEKQNKINNKINNNEISRKNKFERTKTLAQLKNQKMEGDKKSKGKSINKKEKNDHEKRPYNNLYDKYIDKFKEKMKKRTLNDNYKTNEDSKKHQPSKSIPKKEILKKYATQTNFFKRKKDKKTKEDIKEKLIKEVPKKQTTKAKIEKRKVGKSVGVKRDKENNIIQKNKDKKENKTRNEIDINIPRRSKSMAKLTDNTKKNLNNEKYDIDYILYGKIKPSKYEDPFDDIDSIVRHIDFNRVKLNSKNIFDVEGNDKYENYSKNFDNLFNKDISKNLRKSIEKDKSNEKNDNNINLIQNENTTDSFKKNKINVSFIENQNN